MLDFEWAKIMKVSALPLYQELDSALNTTQLKLHPSQVHGVICGILSGKPNTAVSWEEIITGASGPIQVPKILEKLYNATVQQLKDFLFELELVLPADSELLPARAEALTLWCQGFLTGLKLADVPIDGRGTGEASEAIADLIEIAKIDYEEVVASEEDENAYMELVEYVRMAAILIYQEGKDQKKSDNSLRTSSEYLH